MIDDEPENDENQPRFSLLDYERINYTLRRRNFRRYFRIDKEVFMQIEEYIGRHLIVSRRNNALNARQQILTTLNFLGNGSQYHSIGLMHNVSKSTVFRCIHRVCRLIVRHLMPVFLRWPTTSIADEQLFRQRAGFPNVKGLIDGTLIHINAPSYDEPTFVGRDNKHSINLLVVCGPRHRFYFASALSPGSFHDARSLRISRLWTEWGDRNWRPDNDNSSIILGDSAYPLTSWLMPPNIRTANANDRLLASAVPFYERSHRKTRCIVECAIGILKKVYPCLNYLKQKNPADLATIIYACIILHNIQNIFRDGSYAYDEELNRIANEEVADDEPENQLPIQDIYEERINGVNRQREVLEYFARVYAN